MKNAKKYLFIFFAINVVQSLAANFAHPATPTIIKNLALPDYMFGVAFAGMSITNFLFSPFWGRITDQIGRRKVLLLGGVGYALGQALFGMATTQLGILFGRMVSGFFIGAWTVSQLSYILDLSSPEKKGRNFTILATIQSVGSAFGYFIGGALSQRSIPLMFLCQVIILALCGILSFLMLKDNPEMEFQKSVRLGPALRAANPLAAFFKVGREMTPVLVLLSFVTLFASFSAIAYDQCFNFFVKDQLFFTPGDTGNLRAFLGIVSFTANMTLGLWIMKKTNLFKSLFVILTLYGTILCGLLVPTAMPIFLGINTVLYTINALYNPLIQATFAAGVKDPGQSGAYMGIFSSVKALGNVIGSLFAGFIYAFGPRLSFLYAAVGFAVAAVLALLVIRARTAEIKQESK